MFYRLQNPEKFNLEWATIFIQGTGGYLKLKTRFSEQDYFCRTVEAGKGIFYREYGKGAKWAREFVTKSR